MVPASTKETYVASHRVVSKRHGNACTLQGQQRRKERVPLDGTSAMPPATRGQRCQRTPRVGR
ncbi:hypothetical protein AKJ09_00616 [Labilithrix luteola]|uniref:Uncharacterized protein n=1 Tax=Labilithrix luteola TaxID=1391654 RepID=A0A0K1PKA7_9BACT|nr:hypothetical protein AKJ09_00616 [Labilithrix luteola]